jgi:Uma2 family endonuclease
MIEQLEPNIEIRNGYPTSDGRPMAETDIHRQLMVDLIQTLQDWFAADPNVYVSGNLLLFYEEGNKRRHISPDVFVVFGVPKRPRPNYLFWKEGRGPGVVIELTSASTRREDTRKKFELYRDVLQIPEYFLFDPNGDYLQPQLQGYRLVGGEYRPMRMSDGRLRSRQLDLLLGTQGNQLRLFDPATGRRLPTPGEAQNAAERRAIREAEGRAEAEDRVSRLEAELEALKRKLEGN